MNELFEISIYHYLFVGIFLVLAGIFGTVISKNIFKVLISFVLMFSGIILNFAVFSAYNFSEPYKGSIFALFIIVLVTLQIAVGIALTINIYKFKNNTDTDTIGELKG